MSKANFSKKQEHHQTLLKGLMLPLLLPNLDILFTYSATFLSLSTSLFEEICLEVYVQECVINIFLQSYVSHYFKFLPYHIIVNIRNYDFESSQSIRDSLKYINKI